MVSSEDSKGGEPDRAGDESAIRGLVDAFIQGWNSGDGWACARPFAQDADFTNIMGLRAHGQETIAHGHQEILSTVYRGTRASASVHGIRLLRPDVAIVDVDLTLQDEHASMAHRSNVNLVASRDGGRWCIVSFHNMIPFQRPAAGPTEHALAADGHP